MSTREKSQGVGVKKKEKEKIYKNPCPCDAHLFQDGCLGHRDDCPY